MHHGQNWGSQKNVNSAKEPKLNENRGLNENKGGFINFAEIGEKFINFVEIRGIYTMCIIDLGDGCP